MDISVSSWRWMKLLRCDWTWLLARWVGQCVGAVVPTCTWPGHWPTLVSPGWAATSKGAPARADRWGRALVGLVIPTDVSVGPTPDLGTSRLGHAISCRCHASANTRQPPSTQPDESLVDSETVLSDVRETTSNTLLSHCHHSKCNEQCWCYENKRERYDTTLLGPEITTHDLSLPR